MENFKEMYVEDVSKAAARTQGNDAKYLLVKYKLFFVLLGKNYRTTARFNFRVGETTQDACSRFARGGVI